MQSIWILELQNQRFGIATSPVLKEKKNSPKIMSKGVSRATPKSRKSWAELKEIHFSQSRLKPHRLALKTPLARSSLNALLVPSANHRKRDPHVTAQTPQLPDSSIPSKSFTLKVRKRASTLNPPGISSSSLKGHFVLQLLLKLRVDCLGLKLLNARVDLWREGLGRRWLG